MREWGILNVMNVKGWLRKDRFWQIFPIVVLVVIHIVTQLAGSKFNIAFVIGEILLVLGWILGQLLAEADDLYYVYMCDTQTPTCQQVKERIAARDWKGAGEILRQTKAERTRLPIKNILTGLVMAGLGIWIVTSNSSLLGWGVVLGLSTRLFYEILREKDFQKWYWVFERSFSENEHKGLVIAWGIVLAVEWLVVMGR